ncbi:sure-like protein [Multifurca ochricompacta]|uniref:Sure-like protein n=1 Tax=Multifurca ochricompacta TaxID=376703 RepID=A0AAD4QTK6_9AGAM|nr:sure-like protein [Multifurca ochricompacta]
MTPKRFTVLLTNDDGPPGPESPYIFGLYKYLSRTLGWDVRVVIPSSQKSWIGKAYQIKDIILGRFYYPRDPDGLGETSDSSRALKEGEIGEWILLDGTPATCANIALHNLYPGEIDLLLSGPNFGRNTSSAFALSSGTLGAALSSALSQTRSIALSYGTVGLPTPQTLFDPAHTLSAKIIRYLWDNWGNDEGGLRRGEIDFYSVNIPMIHGLLNEGLPIIWTRVWRNTYHRLFKPYSPKQSAGLEVAGSQAGPDSMTAASAPTPLQAQVDITSKKIGSLLFKFSPDMKHFINHPPSSLPEGSDSWAIENGYVSVTPMRASFGEPPAENLFTPGAAIQDRIWRIKL